MTALLALHAAEWPHQEAGSEILVNPDAIRLVDTARYKDSGNLATRVLVANGRDMVTAVFVTETPTQIRELLTGGEG